MSGRIHWRVVLPVISLSWHGGVRVLVQIANYLASKGHSVEIFVSRGRITSPYLLNPDVKLRQLGIHTPWKHFDYAIFLLLLPIVLPRRALFLANFFVTYWPVRVAAFVRGARYAYFVQDIESKYAGIAGNCLNVICESSYRDTNIIAANEYLKARLLREFGVERDSISIGPGDIFFQQARASETRYDVVYFARREPWKELGRFLEVVALSKGSLKFLCVSQDKQLLGSLSGDAVDCICPADDAELVNCIDSARVLLLTSSREGFALPPLEAMARLVPPVLFPCGGPDIYVLDGVNAKYVNSATEALNAIRELAKGGVGYERMRTHGRMTAERFRLARALDDFRGILGKRYPVIVDGEAGA